MASGHLPLPFQITHAPSSRLSPSRPSTPQQSRPTHAQVNSGRSTLRSAEEQLRYLKDGDTSWQRVQTDLINGSSNTRSNSSSNTADIVNGDDRGPKSVRTVRVYLHHVRKTDTLPLILFAYEISVAVLRKANRLWATDSIQSRERLHL